MPPTRITLQLAAHEDFAYIFGLCERTMRSYVEEDLGDCFERIARPTIQKLLQRGLFSKIYADDALVGAIAFERTDVCIQLEEIYVDSLRQNDGIGTAVMNTLLAQSRLLKLPIRLHVLTSNPAREFYEKLGFAVTGSTKVVNYMEYIPLQAIPGDA